MLLMESRLKWVQGAIRGAAKALKMITLSATEFKVAWEKCVWNLSTSVRKKLGLNMPKITLSI